MQLLSQRLEIKGKKCAYCNLYLWSRSHGSRTLASEESVGQSGGEPLGFGEGLRGLGSRAPRARLFIAVPISLRLTVLLVLGITKKKKKCVCIYIYYNYMCMYTYSISYHSILICTTFISVYGNVKIVRRFLCQGESQ